MSENENFSTEQEAEVAVEQDALDQQEVAVAQEAVVEQNVEEKPKSDKKFNVLTIVVLATLGLALIMGIVGLCINWLYITSSEVSGGDTLTELMKENKLFDGQYFKGLEAILAFGIITVIAACGTAVAIVCTRLFNIKVLKYVSAASAALLIISALLSLILTLTCTSTDMCNALKSAGVEFNPDAGACLLSVFGIIGGVFGVIGALDSDGAKAKEWLRKRIVGLKRKPQNIALVVLFVTSILFLMSLNTLSFVAFKTFNDVAWLGLCIFVSTLFSILVLVLYLNTFPKYPKVNKKTGKKHYLNYLMMALVFLFIAAMIAVDIIFFTKLSGRISGRESRFFLTMEQANKYKHYWSAEFADDPQLNAARYVPQLFKSLNLIIAHVVMLSISAVLLAMMPLYQKLILKINTKKEIADNDIKEVVDTED